MILQWAAPIPSHSFPHNTVTDVKPGVVHDHKESHVASTLDALTSIFAKLARNLRAIDGDRTVDCVFGVGLGFFLLSAGGAL